jgi:hypothetical protein
MKQRILFLGVALVAALTVAGVALAGNAHFVGTPTLTVSGNTLTVAGKVAGLGNVPQINVAITATAECINPGSKKPQAANKESLAAEGTFPVQNGKANFSLSATATFQPDCTPPMTLVFSNVVVTVTADDGTFLQHAF